jgi:hypothetical protein
VGGLLLETSSQMCTQPVPTTCLQPAAMLTAAPAARLLPSLQGRGGW